MIISMALQGRRKHLKVDGRVIDIIAREAHAKFFDHAHFSLKLHLFFISDAREHEFLGL